MNPSTPSHGNTGERELWRITLSEYPLSDPVYTEDDSHAESYRSATDSYDLVRYVPASQLDQVCEERDAWKGKTEPDISPGDVIAAEPDGTITLDDGITTWNPARAVAFLVADEKARADKLQARVEGLEGALEEIVRVYNDDDLSNAKAQDKSDEIARAALATSPPNGEEPRYIVRQQDDPEPAEHPEGRDASQGWEVVDTTDDTIYSDWFTESDALAEAARLNDRKGDDRG